MGFKMVDRSEGRLHPRLAHRNQTMSLLVRLICLLLVPGVLYADDADDDDVMMITVMDKCIEAILSSNYQNCALL